MGDHSTEASPSILLVRKQKNATKFLAQFDTPEIMHEMMNSQVEMAWENMPQEVSTAGPLGINATKIHI